MHGLSKNSNSSEEVEVIISFDRVKGLLQCLNCGYNEVNMSPIERGEKINPYPTFIPELGKEPSQAYFELVNLYNAAINHKEQCENPCYVSLSVLKETAIRLSERVNIFEGQKTDDILNHWPL